MNKRFREENIRSGPSKKINLGDDAVSEEVIPIKIVQLVNNMYENDQFLDTKSVMNENTFAANVSTTSIVPETVRASRRCLEVEEVEEVEEERKRLTCNESFHHELYYERDEKAVQQWSFIGKQGIHHSSWKNNVSNSERLLLTKYYLIVQTWGYDMYGHRKYEALTHSPLYNNFGRGLQEYTDILMRCLDHLNNRRSIPFNSDIMLKLLNISNPSKQFMNRHADVSQFLDMYLRQPRVFELICSLASYYKYIYLDTTSPHSMVFIALSVGAQLIIYIYNNDYDAASNLARLARRQFETHIVENNEIDESEENEEV